MDEELYQRLDSIIDVLNRIEKRLGQLSTQSAPEHLPAARDQSLPAVVRQWAEQLALAVSSSDVNSLLDSVQWDGKRLRAELQRLSKHQAEQPKRSLRRLLASL